MDGQVSKARRKITKHNRLVARQLGWRCFIAIDGQVSKARRIISKHNPLGATQLPTVLRAAAENANSDGCQAPAQEPRQGTTRIRLAECHDVGHIHRMVRQMAEYEQMSRLFRATEENLKSAFFPTPPRGPPFHTITVLLLEINPSACPSPDGASINPYFSHVLLPATLPPEASDTEAATFASPRGGGWVTVGYVVFFPSFSTIQAEHGFFMENLFIRTPYRRRGLGKLLFRAFGDHAKAMGIRVIDFLTKDNHKDTIGFYEEGMGAHVWPGWCHCRHVTDPAYIDALAGGHEESAEREG